MSQIKRESLYGNTNIIHEVGCGAGDNVIFLKSMFPNLKIIASDFNEEQIQRLKNIRDLEDVSFEVIDLMKDYSKFTKSDILLMWGVDFAIDNKSISNIVQYCSKNNITSKIHIFSNHILTSVPLLKKIVKDSLSSSDSTKRGRLIGWHRSVKLISQLMSPYKLERFQFMYGGSSFSLLCFNL